MEKETDTLIIRRKVFFRIANDSREYMQDILPTEDIMEELRRRRVDIFFFLERRWCCPIKEPSKSWLAAKDNVAILNLKGYDKWWKNVGKKTRNMVRKAEKLGIRTEVAEPDERLAEGIWKIYNETPIRQERGFPHYGVSLNQVMTDLHSARDCTYIGAYFQDELAGFIQLVHGENIEIISQILSLQKHWDKAVNNALVAKAVEVCASKEEKWIMYGRIGNHPSLDNFKQSNGFTEFQLTRYYVPITRKGKIATKLGLHREIKDSLPKAIKYPLFPLYSWVSRTRMRIKLLFKT